MAEPTGEPPGKLVPHFASMYVEYRPDAAMLQPPTLR